MKEILHKKIIQLKRFFLFLIKKKYLILFLTVLFCSIFLRFYKIETKNPFGWDQLDNAWAAQKIIVNHNFPLIGMQAKGNSGVFIGPLYYYLVSSFYFLTQLDPIASGIFAGVTSIFSFLVLYFVTKKIFNRTVGLIAVFINSFSFWGLYFDRVQWPVNFIPVISILVFYFLFKIITGNPKFILFLAAIVGFSFHIHFTSIFYPIIISFCLPFFPRMKQILQYAFLGFLIFIIFISPILIYLLTNLNNFLNAASYGNNYYHGFHLQRVMQLVGDAFIQFDFFLKYELLKPLKFLLVPLFVLVYLNKKNEKKKYVLPYLVTIFFLIPWIVMSSYSGELSDYYFASTRFVALIIIAYFLYLIYSVKSISPKIILVLSLVVYGYFNINEFLQSEVGNPLRLHREKALKAISNNQKIEFKEGVPEVYLYYYYMYKKGIKVY